MKLDGKKYVLRSTYQVLVEQNKKLISDIQVLVSNSIPPSFEKLTVVEKWRKYFNSGEQLIELLKVAVKDYYEKNPKKKTAFIKRIKKINKLKKR